MKFELIRPVNENYDALHQILTNRAIPYNKVEEYMNSTDENINSWTAFGEDICATMKNAAAALMTTIATKGKCLVIIDSDCDGYTSGSLLINYLYDHFPAWVQNHLTWFIHQGKQHGLSDFPFDDMDKYDLVICPDSSSNDYEYHQKLREKYIQVIVLDHHEAEKVSEFAFVINNQLSDYPNKDFSGVGITWQFCRYLDSLIDTHYADDYLDLVALGNCADMMSMTSIETKHIINKGFKRENIKNPKITLPQTYSEDAHVWHVFVVRCNDRDALQKHLEANDIQTNIHYPTAPHKQGCYSEYAHFSLPVTEKIHAEVMSLPISPVMTDDEVKKVVEVVNGY